MGEAKQEKTVILSVIQNRQNHLESRKFSVSKQDMLCATWKGLTAFLQEKYFLSYNNIHLYERSI